MEKTGFFNTSRGSSIILKTIEGQSIEGTGNIDLTKADVDLANVDNTSDIDKPISTAQQTALDLKENSSNKIATFQSTPDDTKYPTEKLVKDNLDLKENIANKTSSFQITPNDDRYPTEKLVKDNLDLKINISDIIDSLTSTDTNKPLSANQGKALEDAKANKIIGGTDQNIVIRDANGDIQDSANSIADVKARANHTGEQAISTITGLQTALDDKIPITDIVDSLASTDTNKPLSANQGKILQDTKANKIISAVDGNLIKQNANGDIADTGVSGVNFNGDNQLVKTDNAGKINAQKGIVILTGSGTPEGSIIGYTGQVYRDTSGGELWQKATGENTNTGWKQLTGAGGSISFGTTSGTATEGNDSRLLIKRMKVLIGGSNGQKKGVSFSYGITITNPFFSLAMTSSNNNDAFVAKVVNITTTNAFLEVYRADGSSWADSTVSCYVSIYDGTY